MLDRSPNHAPMDVNSDALGCVISGYSCRLPGAPSASDFWALLSAGRAAIGEIGPERFAAARYASADLQEAGTSYTFRAGLIDDLWAFDPGFFGLSPREAKQMDPQQRLLLQVAWEAVEHAGLRLSQLKAGRTGVYVGASASDYSTQFYGDPARVDAPFMLGNTLSILSNRLSYVFDLTGPTYTVDTACSSSFYALDQAHRALLQGEIDTAIVGSVNVLLSPISFIGFSRAGMLSPNGRCAFLDAAADGYVRAEGAVAFVLRREDAAVENGDPVRGHLLATGINADGRTTGLALPSAARQAALMERLRDEAGLAPDDVAFAEAHGTGTRAGDLAEATSLGQIYGQGRAAPLPVGSAKTNVGHLEPASGLVGLLKAQMALEQGVLPPSLHIAEPNPEIDLETLNLAPATVPVTLPDRADPNAAVINSFGFGGANAHAILGASTSAASGFAEVSASKNLAHKGQASDANAPLILSAATADALKALADKWAPRLMQADAETGARLINHAAWRRERMAHSLVASGESSAEIGAALAQHLSGNSAPAVVTGSRTSTGRTTFVFSGNGSQWFGMGRHLFENDPQFRSGVSKTSEMFKAEGGLDISALLIDPELESKLNRASVGQSLLFTIQTALVQCLASRGVEPDAVAGHSVGEVAAAWCAGALSLQDAVRLIQARASLLETLHGTGGMAAVLSGVDALEEALDAFAEEEPELGSITLAADNNPRSTTISGAVETIDAFAKFARARRLAVKRLDVPYPYHSALVEPVREGLMRRIEGIEPRPTKVDFVSSTTGEAMLGELLGPEFWWMNTRAPVRFRQAVGALTDAGCRVFVELGPRPVLQNYVTESAKDLGVSIQYAPTLEQGRHQNRNLSQIAARAIAMGARHNELQVFGAPVPLQPDMDLPAYPWQQSQFRAEPTGVSVDVYGAGADDHPLLGWAEHPGSGVWHNHISVARQPWLADHNVGGVTVFPASGYAELVLAVGASEYGRQGGPVPALDLSGLDILQPLLIDKTHTLRTTLARETGTVTIESSPYPENGTWSLHARARVRPLPEDSNADRHYRGDADSSFTTPEAENSTGFLVDAERLYESAALLGLEYGPMFRCFAAGEVSGRAMTLELLVPGDGLEGLAGGFLLHPGCLDGAMHGLAALIAIETGNEEFVADPGATAS
ncbi:MAG: type I polyketide synthase, partial [Pseudomonadota bacterium]